MPASVIVEEGIAARLTVQPTVPTKAIKRLRSNAVAEFELPLGDLRILYNADEESSIVWILVIGRKAGNKLIVEGEEFHEHDSDPAE